MGKLYEEFRNSKLSVNCSKCNSEFLIVRRTLLSKNKLKSPILCRACAAKLSVPSNIKTRWTDEYRNKHKQAMQNKWQTLEYNKKMEEWHSSDEAKKIKSENTKKLWQNDEFKKQIIKGNEIANRSEETHQKRSNHSKKLWQNQEFRNKMTEMSQKLWQNDEYKSKIANSSQPIISKQHQTAMSILDDMNVKYVSEYKLGPWTFDIYIPNNNLLVEINGDWIHSQPHKQKADKAKATYIELYSPKLSLKYIWEHEFYTEGRVKSSLEYWTNTQNNKVEFEFDDITIKEATYDEASEFINKYHYIGNIGRRGQYIGGYIGDKLVAISVFSNCTRKEVATSDNLDYNTTVELSRFCIRPEYHKYNFASWLLSRLVKLVNKKHIVAFSDSSFNHLGTIYKASNWEYLRNVPPDYWYVDKDGWVMHKKTLWNRATNLKLSELEYAEQKGYKKIWGKEKNKFLYTNE